MDRLPMGRAQHKLPELCRFLRHPVRRGGDNGALLASSDLNVWISEPTFAARFGMHLLGAVWTGAQLLMVG